MSDTQDAGRRPAEAVDYDLVVIGAGIAGMNALEVASQYLPRGARVMLVERRARSGGMWCDTYDYVHLHQPHPMFTAGDVEWTLGAPPQHLASKPEILDHFQRCHARVREHFTLDERFGWAYVAHEEVAST